jgi:hypothetical protein
MHLSPFYTILCITIFLSILATELQSIRLHMFSECIMFPPHVDIGFTIYSEFVLFFTWNMFYPCPRNVFPVLTS